MILCMLRVTQIKQYWAIKSTNSICMNCAQREQQILKLGMDKPVWNYDMHAKAIACYILSSIEPELYKQYMDELRASAQKLC